MKKRILAAIIALALVLGLTACNDSGSGGNNGGDKKSSVITIHSGGKEVSELSALKGQKVDIEAVFGDSADTTTVWQSSDESVVKVRVPKSMLSRKAELSAVGAGTATVTATAKNGDKATVEVTVTEATLQAILSAKTLYLDGGGKIKYSDLFTLAPAGANILCSVSDSAILKAENGEITPLKAGVATVTAKLEGVSGVSAQAEITVKDSPLYLTASEITVAVGGEEDIPVVADIDYTVRVENETVAKAENGKIKGVSLGTTKAKITGGNIERELTITVVEKLLNGISAADETVEDYVKYDGRRYYNSSEKSERFMYGAAGFEATFYGTELKASLTNQSISAGYVTEIQVLLDGEKVPTIDANARKIVLDKGAKASEYTIISGLTAGKHTVKVLKRDSYIAGARRLDEFGFVSLKTDGYLYKQDKTANEKRYKIDVYGDSITAGYGNLGGAGVTSENTNALLTYAYRIAENLDADINTQGNSGWGVYIGSDGTTNADRVYYNKATRLHGQTSTEWDFSKYQADLVIINLGENDSTGVSKGTYDPEDFKNYYRQMIASLKEKMPNAKFLLTLGMMSHGRVGNDVKALAESYGEGGGVYFYLLSNYGCHSENGHPTVDAHVKSGNELTAYIRENILK